MSAVTAKVVRQFRATPDAVFDAWITGATVRKWFGLGLGEMARVAVEAREGGKFIFTQLRGMNEVEHVGKYLIFDRPHRLSFTWQVKGVADSSKVNIEIERSSDGTALTLTHELSPHWADYREKTENAWHKMLDAMAVAIE